MRKATRRNGAKRKRTSDWMRPIRMDEEEDWEDEDFEEDEGEEEEEE
jgi:hypothetical protein